VPKIAVDEGLTPVKNLLQDEGFEVVHPEGASGVSVLVTTGMERDMLNIQDVMVGVPVIDARGKTPAEVLRAVKDLLAKR